MTTKQIPKIPISLHITYFELFPFFLPAGTYGMPCDGGLAGEGGGVGNLCFSDSCPLFLISNVKMILPAKLSSSSRGKGSDTLDKQNMHCSKAVPVTLLLGGRH